MALNVAGISTEAGLEAPPPAREKKRLAWLTRSRWVTVGVAIFAVFVFLGIFGPALAPYAPAAMNPTAAAAAGPNAAHWLGTTQFGQDVLSQLLVGTGPTLEIGFLAGIIATFLSILIGVSSGYFGGVVGELLSLLSNIFLVIPALPLLIVLSTYTGSSPSAWLIAVVLAALSWAWGARVLRAQTLSLRQQDFVQAAKAAGESNLRIIFTEILPNEIAVVAASFVYTVIGAVGYYVALLFIGVAGGANSDNINWGTMLYNAQINEAVSTGAWWWYVPPGVMIALLLLSLIMLNFGIDEFINPRLRAAGITRKQLRAGSKQQGITPVLPNRRNAAPLVVDNADAIGARAKLKRGSK
jgi:peptide/nickel transport system permease protein